jgi:hypothetical protein
METAEVPSAAAIGRLINRENLFFRADAKGRTKRSKAALKAHERRRKPYTLKSHSPRRLIEFDMKRVYLLGQKHCAFCVLDPYTKEAADHTPLKPERQNRLEKGGRPFRNGHYRRQRQRR